MPDTPQEKETGRNDCRKCKYVLTCELLKERDRIASLSCQLGVKNGI